MKRQRVVPMVVIDVLDTASIDLLGLGWKAPEDWRSPRRFARSMAAGRAPAFGVRQSSGALGGPHQSSSVSLRLLTGHQCSPSLGIIETPWHRQAYCRCNTVTK